MTEQQRNKYECESCGKESDTQGECCGKPMKEKKESSEGSCGCE